MSARSRAARSLEALLEHEAHGHRINVRWDNVGRGWGWHVEWTDGPTVEQVKRWAHEVAQNVPALDVEELHPYRHISDRAWAVQLVRHVASGGSLENPAGTLYALNALRDVIDATAWPEAPADEQEAKRAEALLRLAQPHSEARMLELLAAHGLAILSEQGDLPPGITRLRPPRGAE